MRSSQLHSLPHLKQQRAILRNGLTPAEEELWCMLKGRGLDGRKFRRQHSIENYIVDFYCASEKLVIEVDGAIHDSLEAIANDSLRDEMLRHWGLKVLRIRNDEVFENLAEVYNKIKTHFNYSPSCF